MDDIFSLLNLDKNSSREEVRTKFLAWKKQQQQALITKDREAQKIATDNITNATVLYKAFMQTNNPDAKSNGNTIVESVTFQNNVKLNEKKLTFNPSNVEQENQTQKIIIGVLSVILIVMGAYLLKVLHDNPDNDVSISSNFVNPFPSNPNITHPIQESPNNQSNKKNSANDLREISENPKTDKKETIIPDKNPGKTPEQRAAIQTLFDFHENITNKHLRAAYNLLSGDFQSEVSYDGWAPGFNTTVSSSISDVKIVSSSSDHMTVTYVLTAVDNPGGTTYFNGTATIILTNEGWKIHDIKNKFK